MRTLLVFREINHILHVLLERANTEYAILFRPPAAWTYIYHDDMDFVLESWIKLLFK